MSRKCNNSCRLLAIKKYRIELRKEQIRLYRKYFK